MGTCGEAIGVGIVYLVEIRLLIGNVEDDRWAREEREEEKSYLVREMTGDSVRCDGPCHGSGELRRRKSDGRSIESACCRCQNFLGDHRTYTNSEKKHNTVQKSSEEMHLGGSVRHRSVEGI
jgi:hypothetical protein